jgi:hypothetical protein
MASSLKNTEVSPRISPLNSRPRCGRIVCQMGRVIRIPTVEILCVSLFLLSKKIDQQKWPSMNLVLWELKGDGLSPGAETSESNSYNSIVIS